MDARLVQSSNEPGATFRGKPFTREQILTGAVFRGGDGPFPFGGPDPDGSHQALCRLLRCVLGERALAPALKRWEVDPHELERCLERYCRASQPPREGSERRAFSGVGVHDERHEAQARRSRSKQSART